MSRYEFTIVSRTFSTMWPNVLIKMHIQIFVLSFIFTVITIWYAATVMTYSTIARSNWFRACTQDEAENSFSNFLPLVDFKDIYARKMSLWCVQWVAVISSVKHANKSLNVCAGRRTWCPWWKRWGKLKMDVMPAAKFRNDTQNIKWEGRKKNVPYLVALAI